MRKRLKENEGVRTSFQGTFSRCGSKRGGKITVLLTNVRKDNKMVTNHLWFNLTQGFKDLCLCPGDKVYFDCRVKEYEKGYKGRNEEKKAASPVKKDYMLNYPTNLLKDWSANSQSNKILRFYGGKKSDWELLEQFLSSRNSVTVARDNNLDVDKCWEAICRCKDVCHLKPIKRAVTLAAIEMKKDESFINKVMNILDNNNVTIRNFGELSESEFKKFKGAGKLSTECFSLAQKIFNDW